MFFLFLKKSLFCALLFLLYLKNCIPHLHFTLSRSDFSWGKQQPCATTHRYSFLSAAGSPIWPLDLSSPSPHFLHPLTSCRPAARPSRPSPRWFHLRLWPIQPRGASSPPPSPHLSRRPFAPVIAPSQRSQDTLWNCFSLNWEIWAYSKFIFPLWVFFLLILFHPFFKNNFEG